VDLGGTKRKLEKTAQCEAPKFVLINQHHRTDQTKEVKMGGIRSKHAKVSTTF
jgi:hypothetical protein